MMSIVGRPRQPAEERFWEKVDKSGDCWEWTAGTFTHGYGAFSIDNHLISAHRFAYSLVYGPIPEEMLICHHCDNPSCVNPEHLFMGTQSDNMRDSFAKGRGKHPILMGEKNGASKLVENDVYEIRRLRSLGVTQALLAKMWGISEVMAGKIVRWKNWKHI